MINPDRAIKDLHTRYTGLLEACYTLPETITAPKEVDVEELCLQFSTVCLTPPLAPANPDLLFLALCGFERPERDYSANEVVVCAACFRTLPFWIFLPRPNDVPCMTRLEVDEQHRPYCPWTNAETQNRGCISTDMSAESLPAWRIVLGHLKQAYEMKIMLAEDMGQEARNEAAAIDVAESREEKEVKDRDRWARVKKLKQAFTIKRRAVSLGKGLLKTTPSNSTLS